MEQTLLFGYLRNKLAVEVTLSKFPLFVVFFLLFGVMLGAEDFALRQATDVRWAGLHVHTADNCEIVFWSDAILGDMDVYAQKINPSGVAVWSEPLLIVDKTGDQAIMDVVKTSDNNFIILWREYEIEENLGVWAQKITSNGQRLWGDNGVEIADGGLTIMDAIPVANAVGGAFIIYAYGYASYSIMGQYLDALGNQLWQEGGIPLVSFSSYVNLEQALSDAAGGVIINYSNYQDSQNLNHLVRISDTGSVIGNNPLIPAGAFPGQQYQIMTGSSGQYILYYVYNDINPFVRLAKIDNLGNLLLPQIVEYPLSTYDVALNVTVASISDGGLAVAWKSSTEAGEVRWRVQRLSGNFVPLWQEPGVQFGSSSFDGGDISMSVGTNDNVWLAWDNTDNAGIVRTVKAQMVSSTGVPAWTAEGMTLSADNGSPRVVAYPDRAMFVWNPDLEGKTSVRRQVISSGGALWLAENGEPLVQRIYGQAYLGDVIALDNKYLSIWSDDRGTGQIFYQLSNSNMEPLLEENGRALNSPFSLGWAGVVSVQRMDENKVAVLYFTYDNASMQYYLQLIDSNGNPLYPDNGIALTFTGNDSWGTMMSTLGEDIYIAWRSAQSSTNQQIRGQRIVNGQLMWGENGRVIVPDSDNVSISLEALQGRYFVWSILDYQSDEAVSKVLLVNENGDHAPGWDASGLSLVTGDNSYYQDVLQSGIVEGDLVVFISYSDGSSIVRAQRISSDGGRMWGENGIEPGLPGQINWIYGAVYDDGITCLMQESEEDVSNIRGQKLSPAGEKLWGEEGCSIADGLHNSYDAQIGKFVNGSYFVVYTDNDGAWIQNRDVFIRYITPLGEPQGEAPIVLCGARYQQDNVQAAVLENQALIAWSDDRAGIINSEVAMTGVWGVRIVSDYVFVNDPQETPPAMITIGGNHPNPFNASTTLVFGLARSGAAEVTIYNLRGQAVRKLLMADELSAGTHDLLWDGCDDRGVSQPAGVYLVKVSSLGRSVTHKMVLVK
jgi:hypothetical protein